MEIPGQFSVEINTVLTPGKAALIRGGMFYQLENTGTGAMVLMGNRSGSQENVKIIDYVTRQDIRAQGKEPIIRNRNDA